MDETILESRFGKSENVVFRKIAEEFILVPIHKEAVDLEALFSLNETAARIWELIDERRTGLEIAGIIAEEFSRPQEQILRDTGGFFHQLRALNFIAVL